MEASGVDKRLLWTTFGAIAFLIGQSSIVKEEEALAE